MQIRQLVKLAVGFIKHPIYCYYTIYANDFVSSDSVESNIKMAADWLITAQNNSTDGLGYARKFSLIDGWDKGYIETTGYIIPTMLDVADYLSDSSYAKTTLQSAEWLLTKQLESGAFPDTDKNLPQVFDTGQVLLGLNYLINHTEDKKYNVAADKAAQWLVSTQEENGAWVKNAYNFRPHSYYTRVASALYETGLLLDRDEFCNSAVRYYKWVITQQVENGFFRYSEFDEGEASLLHTIVYVLEGLVLIYDLTGDEDYLKALVTGSEGLIKAVGEEKLPYSRYDINWRAVNAEYCVTGLAQWAGVCCDLFRITRAAKYKNIAEYTLNFLTGSIVGKGKDIKGALPSSIPFWGYYGAMEYYNWNTKFYIDAMIKFSRIEND